MPFNYLRKLTGHERTQNGGRYRGAGISSRQLSIYVPLAIVLLILAGGQHWTISEVSNLDWTASIQYRVSALVC